MAAIRDHIRMVVLNARPVRLITGDVSQTVVASGCAVAIDDVIYLHSRDLPITR